MWPSCIFLGINKPTETPFASLVTMQSMDRTSLLKQKSTCPEEFKKLMVQEYKQPTDCSIQSGSVPSNLKSRLLAPTEREYEPSARIQD